MAAEYYLILVLLLAGALAVILVSKVQSLKSEIAELRASERNYSSILQALVRRVHVLESARQAPAAPGVEQPQQIPQAVHVPFQDWTPPILPPPFPQTDPTQLTAEPSTPTDWEALIGGNLLNKIGALVLVVGIGLFLGYSITMLGAGGKVAIGLAIGVSMLVSGLLLERREDYVTFGRGFIGGGWAAIYFTVYAAHALEAARIIHDPVVASILLVGVAALMILHSLRYQREAVTALAYIIGFVSLSVSPLTAFSMAATLILALSILAVSYRASWYKLGFAGLLLTYVTFQMRYDINVYAQPGILNAQSMLWIYWICFESFDLLHRFRGEAPRGWAVAGFWCNAFFFLFGTWVHGGNIGIADWSAIASSIALAFGVSAAARYYLRRPSESFLSELAGGGFGSAIAIATAYSCVAVVETWNGITATIALLAIVQALVVVGMLLDVSFLRKLGLAFHLLPFLHWFDVDSRNSSEVTVAGLPIYRHSLTALLLASTYIVNRLWTRSGWIYGSAAISLIGIVIHDEFQRDWGTVAWAFLSGAIAVLGWYRNNRELRINGYLLIAATALRTFAINLETEVSALRIATVGLVVIIFYAAVHLMRREEVEGLDRVGRGTIAVIASLLVFALLKAEVQGRLVTVAWGMQGAGLLVAGFAVRDKLYRMLGLLLFLFCIGKLFFFDLSSLDTLSRIFSFIVLGLLLLAASWVYTRYREQIRRLL